MRADPRTLRGVAAGFILGAAASLAAGASAPASPGAAASLAAGGAPPPALSDAVSEAESVFSRTLGQMLEIGAALPDGADPNRVRLDNQLLFCRFDQAMNRMTVAERSRMSADLLRTRDALVGKSSLERHGAPLPQHTECPDYPPQR